MWYKISNLNMKDKIIKIIAATKTKLGPEMQEIFMKKQFDLVRELIEKGIMNENTIEDMVTNKDQMQLVRETVEEGIEKNQSDEEIVENFIKKR